MDKVLENRICLLIKEMTLEEKTGMIHGAGLFRTAGVERIHIPPLKTVSYTHLTLPTN